MFEQVNNRVIINAMLGPWPEEKLPGDSLYGVNRSGFIEPRMDRIYTFDAEHHFSDDYVQCLGDLDVPVYTRDVHPEIPNSVKYPKEEIVDFFHGITYSTCTIAWILQHVIYEHCTVKPVDQLVLANMYHPRDSVEYLTSVPCVNYWVGVAMGYGMNVLKYGNVSVACALPWESNEYGYVRNKQSGLCIGTIAAAYKACYEYPRTFITAEGEIAATEDMESLCMLEEKYESMLAKIRKQKEAINTPRLQPA